MRPASSHSVEALEAVLDGESGGRVSRREVPHALLIPSTIGQLLRMAAEEWGMILGLSVVVFLVPDWLYPIVLVPLAGRYHALGVILHDATHMVDRPPVGRRRVLELLCGYPLATTLRAMRYHHLRHHRDSGMSSDPYFKAGSQTLRWWTLHTLRGALLFPFWVMRAVVGVAAAVLPAFRNFYGRAFLQDRSDADLTRSAELIACARDEWYQLAFHVATVPAFVLWPRATLLLYVVPVTLGYVVSARRLLIEHHYETVGDRRAETILATTNDNHLGWLGAIVLAPRNVGYHVVHHLHPQVSLRALPRLRAWYQARHPESYPAVGVHLNVEGRKEVLPALNLTSSSEPRASTLDPRP